MAKLPFYLGYRELSSAPSKVSWTYCDEMYFTVAYPQRQQVPKPEKTLERSDGSMSRPPWISSSDANCPTLGAL